MLRDQHNAERFGRLIFATIRNNYGTERVNRGLAWFQAKRHRWRNWRVVQTSPCLYQCQSNFASNFAFSVFCVSVFYCLLFSLSTTRV